MALIPSWALFGPLWGLKRTGSVSPGASGPQPSQGLQSPFVFTSCKPRVIIYHGSWERDSAQGRAAPGVPISQSPVPGSGRPDLTVCRAPPAHPQRTEPLSPPGFLFSPPVFEKLWWEQNTSFKGGPERPFCGASGPGTSSVVSEGKKTWTKARMLGTLEVRPSLISHWRPCLISIQTQGEHSFCSSKPALEPPLRRGWSWRWDFFFSSSLARSPQIRAFATSGPGWGGSWPGCQSLSWSWPYCRHSPTLEADGLILRFLTLPLLGWMPLANDLSGPAFSLQIRIYNSTLFREGAGVLGHRKCSERRFGDHRRTELERNHLPGFFFEEIDPRK